MFQRTAIVPGVITIAIVLSAMASVVCGQDVGDSVKPRKDVELKVRDRTIAKVGPRDLLTVEKLNDSWLWVKTEQGLKGWIQKSDVEPAVAAASEAPASPDQEPAETTTVAVDDRLYLIGAMGATHVYLTYAYIGAVGDSYVNKNYDAPKVQELMGEVSGMTDHLITQLRKVRGGELTNEDRKAIDDMIEINVTLKKQAEALAAYSRDSTDENAKAFEDIRTEVWPKISGLLGINQPAAAESTPATDADPDDQN